MLTCSVHIAASVDGYIARRDGDIDWLQDPDFAMRGQDLGYEQLMRSIDVVVMGRRTFEKVLSFGPWPYGETPTVVLSSGRPAVPEPIAATVVVRNCTPEALVSELAAAGARHAYVDGGVTIQRFLRAGLIDSLTITTAPVLLGGGVPLFGEMSEAVRLSLRQSRSYPNGFVQNVYAIERGPR